MHRSLLALQLLRQQYQPGQQQRPLATATVDLSYQQNKRFNLCATLSNKTLIITTAAYNAKYK